MTQPHYESNRSESTLRRSSAFVRSFTTKIGFGDVLLFFYFIVFARPWFWSVNNSLAWFFTIPIALLCWFWYVATTPAESDAPHFSFWLVVALPLVFAYAIRAPFPDASFDVWSLRLFHGERGLTGFIYHSGEFFPTSAPFNPTPDMLTGIFRHLLGYRLGTILNLLVLVWCGTILDKLLRPYIERRWLRSASILLVLWIEHLLFEINNYMVDLLALPLMLEATRLILTEQLWQRSMRTLARVAFLLGGSVALKLSNGVYALPLIAICIWRLFAERPATLKKIALDACASVAIGIGLLAPFMFWVWRLTGSPLFPIYNGIFRSSLYPASNGWDGRWGGFGAREILPWPVLIFFEPERTSEINLYSGRLSVGFLVAILCLLLWRWTDRRMRIVSIAIVVGSLLWSLTMGYIRYGLYLEVMSGVLLIIIAARMLRSSSRQLFLGRAVLATSIIVLMMAQTIAATDYLMRAEWSMRPTVFQEPASYLAESRYLLRDRSIRDWMTPDERVKFDAVDVWIVSGSKTAGLVPFLNPHAPVLGVRSAGIYTMPESRREFAQQLDAYSGKAIYSIAIPEDYQEAVKALANVGLTSSEPEPITVPFFAPSHPVTLYLFPVNRSK